MNNLPTVTLSAPVNGAVFAAGATITLTAEAADTDGQIARVELYTGETKVGEDTEALYSYSWTGVSTGTYTLTARAVDSQGAVATSNAASVRVNQSPVAHASGAYSGQVRQNIQFNGGNSYDPDGQITSYAWNFGDGTSGTGATSVHVYYF